MGNLLREWIRDTLDRMTYEQALEEAEIKIRGRLSMARKPRGAAATTPPPAGDPFQNFGGGGATPFPGAPSPGAFPGPVAGFPQAPAASAPGQPVPFGAPAPGFPQAPPNGAPGPFGPPTGAPAGSPVNQHTVGAAMQAAGAAVGSDPATSQAIVAIGGSLKDIEAQLKDLTTKLGGALQTMGQAVTEANKKLDALLADQMQQAQAPAQAPAQQQQAAPAPTAPAAPAQDPVQAVLNTVRSAVQAKYQQAQAAGQAAQFRADNPATWQAMVIVAQQAGHQITPEQLYGVYQQAGLISAPGPDGATYVLP